jgi:hypothetical protein
LFMFHFVGRVVVAQIVMDLVAAGHLMPKQHLRRTEAGCDPNRGDYGPESVQNLRRNKSVRQVAPRVRQAQQVEM